MFSLKTSQQSSVYRKSFDLTAWGMPFIYMRNSKRPTMNPCGTHHVIFEGGFLTFS